MKKNLIISIALVLLFIRCDNKPAQQDTSATTLPLVNQLKINQVGLPKWDFIKTEDSVGTPKTTIRLAVPDTIVLTESIGHFSEVSTEEYDDKKLPKGTLSACSGFWAGLEQQLVLLDSSDYWVIKEKFIDEGSDGTETFETLKAIPKNKN